LQPTVALREEARQAAETALTLQPNLGEAVLAKGSYHYACLKDYDTAERYFEQARPLLPNSSQIPESLAYVARRTRLLKVTLRRVVILQAGVVVRSLGKHGF